MLTENYSKVLAELRALTSPRRPTVAGKVDLEKQHGEKPHHVGRLQQISHNVVVGKVFFPYRPERGNFRDKHFCAEQLADLDSLHFTGPELRK